MSVKCRYCGREIVFVARKSGKKMPCDPELIPFWWEPIGEETFVTQHGEMVRGTRDGAAEEITDVGYIPHECEPEEGKRHV